MERSKGLAVAVVLPGQSATDKDTYLANLYRH
jgi:hypothetical protein